MRFKRYTKIEYGLTQIDTVPLINVVFLLVIFFMLSSSFVMQPGMTVALPRAMTSEIVTPGSLEVVLTAENMVLFDGKAASVAEVKARFAYAAKHSQPVLIKSDRKASMGRLVELWDMARDLGAPQVRIATSQE